MHTPSCTPPSKNTPTCWLVRGLALCLYLAFPSASSGNLNLVYTITNPEAFTPTRLSALQSAIEEAEALWEEKITGYQSGISITTLPISVRGTTTGFASASVTGMTFQGGHYVSGGGSMSVSFDAIDLLIDFEGNGINTVGELIEHETGHILGIGSLWVRNGVYVNGTGRYTGQYGLAAYREEFDPSAEYIPVELAGAPGTIDKHWDQLMRSSSQEGNPADPFSLSPLLGITDRHGRDLGLELMTGAIDPDYGEPFLSMTTVQSLRDMGFTVVPEPTAMTLVLLAVALGILPTRRSGRSFP